MEIKDSFADSIVINLDSNFNIDCALLCIKISVPNESVDSLLGLDRVNIPLYGYIPFSQFILNFDYEII